MKYCKGPSIKDVRSQGSLSGAGILRTMGEGGSSNSDVLTFRRKKVSDFLKFMVCPHGHGMGG